MNLFLVFVQTSCPEGLNLTGFPKLSSYARAAPKTRKKSQGEGASSSQEPARKRPNFILADDIEMPSEAELESCSRVAEAGEFLWSCIKKQALNAQFGWYRGKLIKVDKQSLWDEGDL